MSGRNEIGKQALSRRKFIGAALAGAVTGSTAGGLTATGARAADPPLRNGSARMRLSLAAYSFNRALKRGATTEELKNAPMRMEDFVDYCAELELDACEPTSYYFPSDVTTDHLLAIKNQAFRLGLDISGTAIGNDFGLLPGPERDAQLALTRDWIDRAAILGAPVIRIFAGHVPKGDNEDAAIARCIEGINESLVHAAAKGVFLALENHGGITATPEQMLRIVRGVAPSPWFGVNFDSGNFNTDDPYGDLEQIAPWTVNAQIKVMIRRNGKKEEADFGRVIAILRDAGYRGYVVLEYEEREDPKEHIPRHIEALRKAIGA